MHFRNLLQNLLGVAAAFAAATATAGASWRYLEPQAPRAAEPADYRLGTDGSLWLFGNDGVRRVDAGGATTGFLAALPQTGGYPAGQLTSDGGAVVASPNNCSLTRVDSAVRVRWKRLLPEYCVFVPAADDAVWVADNGGTLIKLGADGGIARQVSIAPGLPLLAAMPDGGVAVSMNLGTPLSSTLTRYSRDGEPLWSLSRNVYFADIAASADGTLTVGGAGADTDGIAVYRFRADGTPVAEYIAPRDPARNEGNIVVRLARDGSASVTTAYYTTAAIVHAVYRFGTDGQLAWRKEACVQPSNTYMPTEAVLPLDGGEAAVACSGTDEARFLRFDAHGTAVADTLLPTLSAELGLRADGTLQALGYAPGTYAMRLYAIDRDGKTVDAPMPSAPEPLDLAGRVFADDGASYLLSRAALLAEPRRLTLAKIDANGAIVWRRTFAAIAPLAQLSVAGGQACVAQSRLRTSPWPSGFTGPPPPPPAPVSIACVASGDGADRWVRTYPTDGAQHWFGAQDDGTFAHLSSQGSTHTIVRHDAAGNEVARVERNGYANSGAIDAAGDIAAGVYDAVTPRRFVVRYDAQGAAHSADIETTAGLEVVGVVAGRVQALVGTSSGREYRWFGTDGALQWSRPMVGLVALPVPDRGGESVYLAERLTLSTPQRLAVRLMRLRATDGSVVWSRSPVFLAPTEFSRERIALDASREQVVLAYATSNRVQAQRFDARDGAPIGEQTDACAVYCGLIDAVGIDPQGLVRAALPITPGDATAATTAIVALRDTFAQPPVRIDQVGLGGAWWAPYASGEGFVADWLPGARTWFMPWFTYSRYGAGGGLAEQRWYVVAGTVGDGATQAQLPILETTGGTFDAAGGATVRRVGTATLRFTDCDNGTLSYVFDAPHNDGATGAITLSRLSPATRDCTLADGTIEPRAAATAGGFDARMSGSWYEEATSGQGLQFTVQPGGVFFAPWFTFDPAGASDDPGRQRWYTLQGSLANATQGRVVVPIAEATGGAFDSMPASRTVVVGAATLTMQDCDRATLEYAFDTAAGDLAGRTGTIDLVKAGGCTP
jgi:hypothetical protein